MADDIIARLVRLGEDIECEISVYLGGRMLDPKERTGG